MNGSLCSRIVNYEQSAVVAGQDRTKGTRTDRPTVSSWADTTCGSPVYIRSDPSTVHRTSHLRQNQSHTVWHSYWNKECPSWSYPSGTHLIAVSLVYTIARFLRILVSTKSYICDSYLGLSTSTNLLNTHRFTGKEYST